jgi:hypothetical protein
MHAWLGASRADRPRLLPSSCSPASASDNIDHDSVLPSKHWSIGLRSTPLQMRHDSRHDRIAFARKQHADCRLQYTRWPRQRGYRISCLVYEEPAGEHLLRILTAVIRGWHDCTTDLDSAWYNTVLPIYSGTKLLQVEGSSVSSHMYGGTAREIGGLFSSIHQLAKGGDDAQLIILLTDDVDKLVPCRRNVGKRTSLWTPCE